MGSKKHTKVSQRSIIRIILLLCIDIFTVIAASFGALWLLFEFDLKRVPLEQISAHGRLLPLTICVTVILMVFWKLYRSVWKYAGSADLLNIVGAVLCSIVVQVLFSKCISSDMPKSYYVLFGFFLFWLVCCSRFSYRLFKAVTSRYVNFRGNNKRNVMIIGAGAAASIILKEIEDSQYINLNVKCLIDDNPSNRGKILRGIPVVGGRDIIPKAAKKYDIDEIIFAIPSASKENRRAILEICKETSCKLRTIPGTYQLINGEVSVSALKEVEIEDLLGRDPVAINIDEIKDCLSGKVILITGGGGSIGSELCRQIANQNPKELIIVDNYENNAYDIEQELKRKYPDLSVVVLIASVSNYIRIDRILEQYKPDVIYHAAAHKHVPLMEDSPNEAVKNNVLGTWNMVRAADRWKVKRFVFISTDKAVNPTNVMGATKRIGEMIIQTYNNRSDTEFVAVRFGNVLGSNGSVIPLFKKQITEGGPVTVTDENIIRYFMTIPEAVSLVLQAGAYAKGGEIFVLDMGEPVKIADLAKNLIMLSGYKVGEDIEIKYTGLRPGEKMYEERLMQEEGLQQTANKMISIGKPLQIDEGKFLEQLKKLEEYIQSEPDNIRELIKTMVPTYKPREE